MSIQIKNQQSAINNRQSTKGFSLTEVLLAVGILAVGMLFIAGVFPVSIHFTMVATERTIAVTVADEAFAKIKLYGFLPITDVNWGAAGQSSFEKVASTQPPTVCFAYPSTNNLNSKYWWSAICRRVGPSDVQVTVFVSRKVGATSQYRVRASGSDATLNLISYPSLIYVGVSASPSGRADELAIRDLDLVSSIDETTFINDGYTIVDDASGRIYRVLERYSASPSVIRLDKDWVGTLLSNSKVWVVSPPVNSGRYPCIGVYQKVMRF